MSHKGRCFCGAVTIEVTGEPEAMGYCHCESCRSWSGVVFGEFPGHVAIHHVLEADLPDQAFRRLGERDLLVDRHLVVFARARDRDRVEHQR